MRVEERILDEELLHHEALVEGAARLRAGTARRLWAILLGAAVAASLLALPAGRTPLVNRSGWASLGRFLSAAASPELSPRFLRLVWDATLTTLSFAVLGTALAVVIGVAGGLLASQVWWAGSPSSAGPRPPWILARGLLALPRGIHEAVWGLFLVGILGLNPLVAVLAIGIPYGAITAKVFAELLDERPRRAWQALRASGAGRLKSFLYTLGPAAFPDMLSYAFYRFECSIRAAAILGIIGAGGLGFQLALSFGSLRYREMWTLLYALAAVSGAADWWSSALRRRSRSFGCRPSLREGEQKAPARDRELIGSVAAACAFILLAAWHLAIDPSTLWRPRTLALAAGLVSSSFPPAIGWHHLAALAVPALQTLQMSVLAAAGAFAAGVVAAYLAARRSGERLGGRAVRVLSRAVLLWCRAIPPPVWAFLLLLVLFPGPLPGALALAVYTFGILGRLMAEVVENHPPGPSRALLAQGAGQAKAFLYGVAPGVMPRFAAFGLYRFEVTIRESVVVGLVGAGGLGRVLSGQVAAFDHRGVAATCLVMIALTLAADFAGSSLRRSIR